MAHGFKESQSAGTRLLAAEASVSGNYRMPAKKQGMWGSLFNLAGKNLRSGLRNFRRGAQQSRQGGSTGNPSGATKRPQMPEY